MYNIILSCCCFCATTALATSQGEYTLEECANQQKTKKKLTLTAVQTRLADHTAQTFTLILFEIYNALA